MKTVLVAGGAGEVGEGIVRQLLSRGHRVLVQSRRLKKIQELAERLGNPEDLIAIAGDIQTERDMESLQDAIGETGYELDGVVASIGSWWSGPNLVDLDLLTYQHVMNERLTTHFLIAKAFLADLQDRAGASYLFIHSAAGYIPIPGSGPVSIAGAAQAMMKDVFAKELEGKAVRVNQLTMMGSIGTRSHPNPDPEGLTNDDVGRYVAYLVEADSVRGETIKFSHRDELPRP